MGVNLLREQQQQQPSFSFRPREKKKRTKRGGKTAPRHAIRIFFFLFFTFKLMKQQKNFSLGSVDDAQRCQGARVIIRYSKCDYVSNFFFFLFRQQMHPLFLVSTWIDWWSPNHRLSIIETFCLWPRRRINKKVDVIMINCNNIDFFIDASFFSPLLSGRNNLKKGPTRISHLWCFRSWIPQRGKKRKFAPLLFFFFNFFFEPLLKSWELIHHTGACVAA